VRRAGYLARSGSLSMVCTMGYVHTILRDARTQFKMGLLGAYLTGLVLLLVPEIIARARGKRRRSPVTHGDA